MNVDVDTSEVDGLAADLAAAAMKAELASTVALTDAANVTAAAARAAAPVLTGELVGSIEVRVAGNSRTVESDAPQGFFQEFGTSRHPPQPWLFPASDRGMDRLVAGIEKIGPDL